jgi:hypothetical protein
VVTTRRCSCSFASPPTTSSYLRDAPKLADAEIAQIAHLKVEAAADGATSLYLPESHRSRPGRAMAPATPADNRRFVVPAAALEALA